jgi:hypothetical protein
MIVSEQVPESVRVASGFADWLAGQARDAVAPIQLMDAGDLRTLVLEEARALGYADDDPVVLLCRVEDGQLFEAELGVTVRPASRHRWPATCSARLSPGPARR